MSNWRDWTVGILAIAVAIATGYGLSTMDRMEREAWVRDSVWVTDQMERARAPSDSVLTILSRYRCYPPPEREWDTSDR